VFDPGTGNFRGSVCTGHGKPVGIEELWGQACGDGGPAGPSDTLCFAAGIDDEAHGLIGTITPVSSADQNDEPAENITDGD
jgi:hypothetical protein